MVCNKLKECIEKFSETPHLLDQKCFLKCSKGRSTDSNLKFEENKKSIVFQNPNRRKTISYWVDGGMIDDTTLVKCDGLFIVLDDGVVVYYAKFEKVLAKI